MTTEFTYKHLPPVGLACEVELKEGWVDCEVIAHYSPHRDGDLVAVFAYKAPGGRLVDQRVGGCFRTIDLSAQDRKTELGSLAGLIRQEANCVDAELTDSQALSIANTLMIEGFRKFEIVEEDV